MNNPFYCPTGHVNVIMGPIMINPQYLTIAAYSVHSKMRFLLVRNRRNIL